MIASAKCFMFLTTIVQLSRLQACANLIIYIRPFRDGPYVAFLAEGTNRSGSAGRPPCPFISRIILIAAYATGHSLDGYRTCLQLQVFCLKRTGLVTSLTKNLLWIC